jgi:hypothetical protein
LQIAMTFNVGLFLAVIFGYALGSLLLSHIPENYAAAQAARRRAARERSVYDKMEAGVTAAVKDDRHLRLSTSNSSTDTTNEAAVQLSTDCCPGPHGA